MAEIEKAQVTLEKLIKNCDDTKVKIAELTKEIKLLKKQHEKLYQEELQNDIAKAWFKEEKLTNEQIYKFLEISKQISDKIDGLETKAVASAVNDVYNQAQQAQD